MAQNKTKENATKPKNKGNSQAGKIIAQNKKALHDYFILEKFEAGIELKGSEVKAIRAGRVNLRDSFVKIVKNEAILFGAHITALNTTNVHFRPNETRPRKLLLHKKEITRLREKVKQNGLTITTLHIHFNRKNYAKILIALARGKAEHDKREDLKRKVQNREIAQALKERQRS